MSRYKWASCTCAVCGQAFKASRFDAKTCSPNCRKRLNRRKDALKRTADRAVSDICILMATRHDYPDLANLCEKQLERIRQVLSVPTGSVTSTDR